MCHLNPSLTSCNIWLHCVFSYPSGKQIGSTWVWCAFFMRIKAGGGSTSSLSLSYLDYYMIYESLKHCILDYLGNKMCPCYQEPMQDCFYPPNCHIGKTLTDQSGEGACVVSDYVKSWILQILASLPFINKILNERQELPWGKASMAFKCLQTTIKNQELS